MSLVDHLSDSRHRRLYEYWQENCPDGRLPAREELDPTQIPSVLKYLILADVEDGGAQLRFRLVGTEMVQFWGDDFTGQYLHDIMQGEYFDYINGLFQECIARAAPVYSESVFRWTTGGATPAKRLLLPYSSDGKTVDLVVVCQIFEPGSNAPDRPLTETGHSPLTEELLRVRDD